MKRRIDLFGQGATLQKPGRPWSLNMVASFFGPLSAAFRPCQSFAMKRADWRVLAFASYAAVIAWLAVIGLASILMGRW